LNSWGIDASKKAVKSLKEFLKEHGPAGKKPPLKNFVFELWKKEEREYQYFAIDVIRKLAKNLKENDIEWIEKMIVIKSWWDTVDIVAASICGEYFHSYPDKIETITINWIQSGNLWLQRSALLFQLKYKKQTNTILLSKIYRTTAGKP